MIFETIPYYYLPILTAINQINTQIDLKLEQMRYRSCCPAFHLYADATGSAGGVHTKHDLIGFKYNTVGGFAGIDYGSRWGGFGLMVDYCQILERPFHLVRRIELNHFHGSVYGTFFPTNALSLNGIVGGGTDDHFDAYFGIEYAVNPCISPVVWTPLFALQYINLNKHHRHIESCRSVVGLKSACILAVESIVITPELSFIWQREFLNNRRQEHLITIFAPHRSIYLAGLNLLVDFCNGFGLEFTYEYEGSRSMFDHYFYAGANVAF